MFVVVGVLVISCVFLSELRLAQVNCELVVITFDDQVGDDIHLCLLGVCSKIHGFNM